MAGGDWDIYVVAADGGVPRQLTTSPGRDVLGTWSRDGRWVYFSSDRTGRREIWKVAVEGGEEVRIREGARAFESSDGRDLYFADALERGTAWRVPIEGGDPVRVIDETLMLYGQWTLSRHGVYYIALRSGAWTIQHLDPASGQTEEVVRHEDAFFSYGLSASPDGQWILYAADSGQGGAELMLMENFR